MIARVRSKGLGLGPNALASGVRIPHYAHQYGLMAMTTAFQAVDRGSIPRTDTKRIFACW